STDTIFLYVKNKKKPYCFNALTEKREQPVKQLIRKKVDGKMVNARDEKGNVLYQFREDRVVDNVWRISMLQPADKTENLFYPTQKPEKFLERIIKASSFEGDLVLDCFCGSGTPARRC
ncbi:MAG TPA: site-specific DNA-methyltransferase, partial [Thiotrichaceae bacterium]|nr:site-specific DNA-methyltransferase [Thiotrichaceae bacterium]